MSKEQPTEAEWKGFLTGEIRGLDRSRRIFARIPSTPRCKLCAAPYGAPGGPILKLFGGGPSPQPPPLPLVHREARERDGRRRG